MESTSTWPMSLPFIFLFLEMSLTCSNSPEWGRVDAQILGPGEKYSWESSWTFGLL